MCSEALHLQACKKEVGERAGGKRMSKRRAPKQKIDKFLLLAKGKRQQPGNAQQSTIALNTNSNLDLSGTETTHFQQQITRNI